MRILKQALCSVIEKYLNNKTRHTKLTFEMATDGMLCSSYITICLWPIVNKTYQAILIVFYSYSFAYQKLNPQIINIVIVLEMSIIEWKSILNTLTWSKKS